MTDANDLTLRNDVTGALIAGGHWHGGGNYEICATIAALCKAANERDELHRKLSCAEAELICQTGCTTENVAGIYNLPIPKPIVSARMGESHRLRFETEDENARLRAQVAELVEALKKIDECRQIATACETCDEVLQAAIAAAEGGA